MRGIKPNAATKRSIPFQRQETNTGSFIPIGRTLDHHLSQAQSSSSGYHNQGFTPVKTSPTVMYSATGARGSQSFSKPDGQFNEVLSFSTQNPRERFVPEDTRALGTSQYAGRSQISLQDSSSVSTSRTNQTNYNQNVDTRPQETMFRGPSPFSKHDYLPRVSQPHKNDFFDGSSSTQTSQFEGISHPHFRGGPPSNVVHDRQLNYETPRDMRFDAPLRTSVRETNYRNQVEEHVQEKRHDSRISGRQEVTTEHRHEHTFRNQGGAREDVESNPEVPFSNRAVSPRDPVSNDWSRNNRRSWSVERPTRWDRDDGQTSQNSQQVLNRQTNFSSNDHLPNSDPPTNWRNQGQHHSSATKRSYDAGPGGPQNSWTNNNHRGQSNYRPNFSRGASHPSSSTKRPLFQGGRNMY